MNVSFLCIIIIIASLLKLISLQEIHILSDAVCSFAKVINLNMNMYMCFVKSTHKKNYSPIAYIPIRSKIMHLFAITFISR